MKKVISVVLIFVLLLSINVAAQKEETSFKDVPQGDYFEQYISKLRELGITQGDDKGNFGFNKNISRAEFLTFLMRLQQLELDTNPNPEMFQDIKPTDWYYPYVNLGLKNKTIIKSDYGNNSFEPNKAMTREEIAIMIVRALQYDTLAAAVKNLPSQFSDVKTNIGYIELAKDLGIINGRGKDIFDPKATATKQEAAAMLIRMYNINNNQLSVVNGFYAIKSFDQAAMIPNFDSIGFGWSRLDYNQTSGHIELSTQRTTGGQPFYIPEDYENMTAKADQSSVVKYLMVFGSNEDKVKVNGLDEKLVSLLLKDPEAQQKLAADIAAATDQFGAKGVSFEGVIIDSEGLRDNGTDKQSFVSFLTELSSQLKAKGKLLTVCINPPREPGQQYYDGYDLASIGALADYVILMAHDYEAKLVSSQEAAAFKGETPMAPLKDVYYAMKLAINGGNGIPKEKLLLQLNFAAAQWQFKDGVLQNNSPYSPEYSKLLSRMKDPNTLAKTFNYSELYQMPYFTYEAEGIKNIIWYEDERSIGAKVRLARLLGVEGISCWRLGLIPAYGEPENVPYKLNIWDSIKSLN